MHADLMTDWRATCAIVFLLGLRHGLDADHLAAIDGLTRLAGGRRFRRLCGALFSLGHGGVVLLLALGLARLQPAWSPPAELETVGAWVSVGFLLALGIANLRAVLQAAPGAHVVPAGFKAALFGRLLQASSGARVLAVGALFALSLDTATLSLGFAVVGAQQGGSLQTAALGLLFLLGMLVVGGLNGWLMAGLIARADRLAARASLVMGLAVATLSLSLGSWGMWQMLAPWLQDPGDPTRVVIATGAVALLVVGAASVRGLARATPPRRRPA